MDIKKARRILILHNEWRKGDDIEMIDPSLLGQAIDIAVKTMREYESLILKEPERS